MTQSSSCCYDWVPKYSNPVEPEQRQKEHLLAVQSGVAETTDTRQTTLTAVGDQATSAAFPSVTVPQSFQTSPSHSTGLD